MSETNLMAVNELRLERITPNIFNGDYAKWSEWRSMYDSLVHNQAGLSDTRKFHYLKRSVEEDAVRVLSGWQAIGANYQAAYESLVDVYENRYRITMAHLEELFNMPRMSQETHDGLRNMVDTTNRVLRQLRVTGSPVELWDYFIIYMLIVRMAPCTKEAWETSQDLNAMPDLIEVVRFLERRARGIINIASTASASTVAVAFGQSNPSTGTNPKAKPQRTNVQTQSINESGRGISCHNCKGPHPMYR